LIVPFYIITSCLNLSAPLFFGIYLLDDLNSVVANILTAVTTVMVFNPSIQFYWTPIEFFGAINYLLPITTAVICIVFCCMFKCVQQNFLGLKVYIDILFAGISEKREKVRIGNSLGVTYVTSYLRTCERKCRHKRNQPSPSVPTNTLMKVYLEHYRTIPK